MVLTEELINKLKVDELKIELKQLGLLTSGKKAELQARLLDYVKTDESRNKDTEKHNDDISQANESITGSEAKSEATNSQNSDKNQNIAFATLDNVKVIVDNKSTSESKKLAEDSNHSVDLVASESGSSNSMKGVSILQAVNQSINESSLATSELSIPIQSQNASSITSPRENSAISSNGNSSNSKKTLLEEKILREKLMASMQQMKQQQGNNNNSTEQTVAFVATTSPGNIIINTNAKKPASLPLTSSSAASAATVSKEVTGYLCSLPPTCHLRINHFQRPLNIPQLKTYLEEKMMKKLQFVRNEVHQQHSSSSSSSSSEDKDCNNSWVKDLEHIANETDLHVRTEQIWLHPIRTHMYITLDSIALATLCKEAVTNQLYTPNNSLSILQAYYTTVSAVEAMDSNSIYHQEVNFKPLEWMEEVYRQHITGDKTVRKSTTVVSSSSFNASPSISSPNHQNKPSITHLFQHAMQRASNTSGGSSTSGSVSNNSTSSSSTVISGDKATGFSTSRGMKRNYEESSASSSAVVSAGSITRVMKDSRDYNDNEHNNTDSSRESDSKRKKSEPPSQQSSSTVDSLTLNDVFKHTAHCQPKLYWLMASAEDQKDTRIRLEKVKQQQLPHGSSMVDSKNLAVNSNTVSV